MINEVMAWLEAHERLSGWAQFLGAIIALGLTAAVARRDGKRRGEEVIIRMKALLHIVSMIHQNVQEARSIQNPLHGSVSIRGQQIAAISPSLNEFSLVGLSSSFMINNLQAAKSHAENAADFLNSATGFEKLTMRSRLEGHEIGLGAICSNISSEISRLGGRSNRYDDIYVRKWLRGTWLSEQLKSASDWRTAMAFKKL
jgi:hypothetical protein